MRIKTEADCKTQFRQSYGNTMNYTPIHETECKAQNLNRLKEVLERSYYFTYFY